MNLSVFLYSFTQLLHLCTGSGVSPFGPIDVHLVKGPKSRAGLHELELSEARRVLYLVKKRLGPKALIELFERDIDAADDFWKGLLKKSKGKRTTLEINVEASVSSHIFNATGYIEWFTTFASKGYPNRLIEGDPNHFVENGTFVVEGWGHSPKSPIMAFSTAFEQRQPFHKALPKFPIQLFVGLLLRDGTKFADGQEAIRDLPDGSGVNIVLFFWLPKATPEYVLEGLKEHVAVEQANFLNLAYEDFVSGRFKPSGQATETPPVVMVNQAAEL